jgi:hypothetical protein
LRKGWQTLDGAKDIGWAEAIGFELLALYLMQMGGSERNFRVYGDNQGVIEGWRNGRSRNSAVNSVFRRLLSFIDDSPGSYSFHPAYVQSKCNPADDPSRGIYSNAERMLPTFPIPTALQPFISDPFVVSTNPAEYETSRTCADVSNRTPVSYTNSRSNAQESDTADSLYHIHELQQRTC